MVKPCTHTLTYIHKEHHYLIKLYFEKNDAVVQGLTMTVKLYILWDLLLLCGKLPWVVCEVCVLPNASYDVMQVPCTSPLMHTCMTGTMAFLLFSPLTWCFGIIVASKIAGVTELCQAYMYGKNIFTR